MLCASSLCDDLHEDKMDVIHTRMLLAVGQQFTNASEHTAITLFFHKGRWQGMEVVNQKTGTMRI